MASSSCFVTLATLLVSATASADVNFANFASTSGLSLLGDAGTASNRLRVTPNQNDQVGAAWFTTPQLVSTNFETEFAFRLVGTPGADGFAFVIQNTGSQELGGGGCELGYTGISNAIAIEIDTYQNVTCNGVVSGDFAITHLSVHTSGTAALSSAEFTSLGSTTQIPNVEDGADHVLRIEYVPGSMDLFIDNLIIPVLTISVDLETTLSLTNGTAYVGFTGATGGASQAHDISSWSFTEHPGTPTGNQSPLAPTINEPATVGQVLNPFDVHMEASAFSDPDAGDQHLCTDWEIWSISPVERVWFSSCATGPEAVHAHLGDGVFMSSLAGQTALDGSSSYRLRVRQSDDSGDLLTRWSPWAERMFVTAASSSIFPLEMDDILVPPQPRWEQVGGAALILPAGATPPALRIESPTAQPLLTLEGFDGATNLVIDELELSLHDAVRVVLSGGSVGVNLPASNLTVTDHDCVTHTLLLPAVNLAAGATATFWISFDGSSYFASAGQTVPDFSNPARGQDFPWVVQEGFEIGVFASGFQLPVNIAFIPGAGLGANDPYFYVTELYGTIKVVDRSGNVSDYASNLIDFMRTGAFPGSGEQGLSGIAVDPLTGDVYAAMLYDSPSFPGTHYPKVVRFTSTDGGMTAATQTTILDMVGEAQGQSHQISHIEFHPDGKLRVHMGDGFAAATAQQVNSYRGKILRLNLDGSAPSDNPFYDAGNGINARDYTWVMGVRNPFGGAYRHTDGEYYIVENGPSIDRFARLSAGMNLGWTGSDASMMNFALHNWIPSTGPVNIAFIEPETFGASGFPAVFHGRAYVTESGPTYAAGPQALGKRISQWNFDLSGNPVLDTENPYLANYVGDGRATAVGLAAGPDGLYMTELYADTGSFPTQTGARILRIRYSGGLDCNDNSIPDACDIAVGTSTDLNGDGVPDECSNITALCTGDGGDQMACTNCPCGNNANAGTIGGCLNSAGTSARLEASGDTSVSLPASSTTDLRFGLSGGPPTAFCILNSGDALAPTNALNPCFGSSSGTQSMLFDGLRCAVMNTRRHGGRSADVNGDVGVTNNPWGGEGGPPAGIAQAGGAFVAGQTRFFQVIHRDDPSLSCMRGLNTSQAISIVFQP